MARYVGMLHKLLDEAGIEAPTIADLITQEAQDAREAKGEE
jgi:hypothetical protein